MTTIFIAEFSCGQPALAKVAVIKETPKTYQVDGETATVFIGHLYIGNRLYKSGHKHHVFATEDKAVEWLMTRADTYAEQCLKKYEGACATFQGLYYRNQKRKERSV